VWGWGHNRWSELGVDATANCLIPVQVRGLTGVVAIAAGNSQSVAIDGNGWIWVLGMPACVYGGTAGGSITDWVTVASGGCDYCGSHSLALRPDGTVWAWGSNFYAEVGDGTTVTYRSTPVQVAGLSGVVGIAAGWAHSVALKGDGTVWLWGLNEYGLGVSEPDPRLTPVRVVPPGSPDLALVMSHDGDFTIDTKGTYTLIVTNKGLIPSQQRARPA